MNAVFISKDNSRIEVKAAAGVSLMEAAVVGGVDGIAGDCGGCTSCGTCHVYIQEPYFSQLPPASAHEDAMLDCTASQRQWNSRLSCQVELTAEIDGITVILPDAQR
jgi:2Fe-2S ferredoxin